MIDLHTHILPNVDDGSSSLEESLALLRMLASQGVTLTAATPHFYATSDKPEQFFLRRESAWQQLSAAMESGMPCVLLGAEVAFYRNISQMQQLERFCIGSSRLLLLEMPGGDAGNFRARDSGGVCSCGAVFPVSARGYVAAAF